jgi:hypothetical protein
MQEMETQKYGKAISVLRIPTNLLFSNQAAI